MSTTTAITDAMTCAYTGRGCPDLSSRKESKMSGKLLLRCRANSEDFGRKLLPRFSLSDQLYQQVSQRDIFPTPPLLNLPAEILALVYETLNHAPSQVALALSCKHMALIARDIDLCLSTYSPKYAGFLPREVFDVPALMQSLTPWMPSSLRLCDHCLTMRPSAREYWLGVDGCEVSNFWITKTGWQFANATWHKQVHNICPACHISCTLSDYVDCDGCRALGRLGDVDWTRISDHWRRLSEEEIAALRAGMPEEEIEALRTAVPDDNQALHLFNPNDLMGRMYGLTA